VQRSNDHGQTISWFVFSGYWRLVSRNHAVVTLYEKLKTEFSANRLEKCAELLSQLKLALTQLSFLKEADQKELLITRMLS
jgi:hypothetical protein